MIHFLREASMIHDNDRYEKRNKKEILSTPQKC